MKIKRIVAFVIVLMLMIVIPVAHNNKLLGWDIGEKDSEKDENVVKTFGNSTFVIDTQSLCPDITGFNGPTPLEIYISDGVITAIVPLANSETPSFFKKVEDSDIIHSFLGLRIEEALEINVDAVSGATYSSNAVLANIRAGLNYLIDNTDVNQANTISESFDLKFFATILIILCGAIVPFILKSRKYRYVQLALNVIVLGFWGGTFLCYSNIVHILTDGFGGLLITVMVPLALLLSVAFIYPLFAHPDHYCNWLCPYGSLQELAGKIVKKKITLSEKTVQALSVVRRALWFILMWLLWTGLCFQWMDFEPFAAFLFGQASVAVLIIAGAFVILSIFINRPYCRFVCPTGTLFKLSEGRK